MRHEKNAHIIVKGFTPQVEGPLGPWYQKVNATGSRARAAATAQQLRDILGEPDTIEHVSDDDRRESEDSPIDAHYPSEYWVYVDPYRPRFHYQFGISAGWIVEISMLRH